MSTPNVELLTRRRGTAKGNVTRLARTVDQMRSLDLGEIDERLLSKNSDTLDRAEESFNTSNDELKDQVETFTSDQYYGMITEFESSIAEVRRGTQKLLACQAAYEQLLRIQVSLKDLEGYEHEPYNHSLESQFIKVEELVGKFQDSMAKGMVKDHPQLLAGQADYGARRLRLGKWRSLVTDLPAVAAADSAAAESRGRASGDLRVKLPKFDGELLNWKPFWKLFSSIMSDHPKMSDPQKQVLLHDSMSTEAARTRVNNVYAYTKTWEEAIAALQKIYGRKRNLHTHYQKDLFRVERRTDDYENQLDMLDQMRRNDQGLKQADGASYDQIVAAHYEAQLPPELERRWREHTAKLDVMPGLPMLMAFCEEHLANTPVSKKVVGEARSVTKKLEKKVSKPGPPAKIKTALVATSRALKCYVCKAEHYVTNCPQFIEKTVEQRREWGRTNKRCANCLGDRHATANCSSKRSCQSCQGRHHTMLHADDDPKDVVLFKASGLNSSVDEECNMPGTAIMTVAHGSKTEKSRGLMDSGAQMNFITRRLVRKLGAPIIPSPTINIIGIERTGVYTSERVSVSLVGLGGEVVKIQPYIIDEIPSTDSGACVAEAFKRPFLRGLQPLADPEYLSEAPVDLLISFGTFNDCTKADVHRLIDRGLRAEPTIFGWVIGGRNLVDVSKEPRKQVCLLTSAVQEDTVDSLLQQYWRAEQFECEEKPSTPDEVRAVQHFHDHVQRDPDGRYCVSLPRKIPTPELGQSRQLALKRLRSTERSLEKKGHLTSFRTTLDDYALHGHAERVPMSDVTVEGRLSYFMPSHMVIKLCSTTTKMRAVFDASALTTSGESLNSTLLPGPSLYPLLSTVVTQFRTHRIGMTADISRMFREIGLNPEERNYHRYLIRDADSGDVQEWRMKRLTFGVTSSPYLATQVLRQVATDYQERYPRAAEIVRNQFYVDDCLTGVDNLEEAKSLREELCSLLSEACMNLRKWRSNSKDLMMDIPEKLRESTGVAMNIAPQDCQKSLGLHWSTEDDTLHVATPKVDPEAPATKRSVASAVARTFDLLGWFCPATLPARDLLQQSWLRKLEWDVSLPPDLQERWKVWVGQLSVITEHPVPRYMGASGKNIVEQQLHGYSDASQLTYGGAVYVRNLYDDDTVSVHLVVAKSKVAPVEKLTVPRLELCAALTLARLMSTVAKDLNVASENLFAWTDAAVVLGWLNRPVTQLKVYVANRVAKILKLIESDKWRYVNTGSNPADILSRGMMPADLLVAELWWEGPSWLKDDPSLWPRRPDINQDRELPETRTAVMMVSTGPKEIGAHISDFSKLVRVLAWVWRYYSKFRRKAVPKPYLSSSELLAATDLLLLHSQIIAYPEVRRTLAKKGSLPERHRLASLSPYLDERGLLRVGGRLQQSELTDAVKHPMILDVHSNIVLLMVRATHRRLLHAGPSTVLSTLAPTHHISGLRTLVRRVSKECVQCQKSYARISQQLMGELPAHRTQFARPFSIVGIDYAGPIMTKKGHARRPTRIKTYILVIVCFTTRAVHLEVVADMSTVAFLAALSRFASRRGSPSVIYSDNGSNFKGAQAQLRQTLEELRTPGSRAETEQWANVRGVEWRFSPARAPHFGGVWEAAVKAMKGLIRKTISDRVLAFDELVTLVTEAEAVLNSRPLVPVDSPTDDAVAPLTPGHFLIGGPILALPVMPDTVTKLPLLRRWELVRRLAHDLERRWRAEYVTQLQRRNKWRRPHRNLEVGDVVLVKDVETFHHTWPLGLVTQIYPGKDGLVRTVDVRSQDKTCRRAIHKLVYLLGEQDDDSPRGENVQADEGGAEVDDDEEEDGQAPTLSPNVEH